MMGASSLARVGLTLLVIGCGGAPAPAPTHAAAPPPYVLGAICGVKWPPADVCTVLRDPFDPAPRCPDHRRDLASFGEPLTAEQSALLDAVAQEMKQLGHLSTLRIQLTPSSLEPAEVAQARGNAIATLLERRGIARTRLDVYVARPATALEEPSRVAFIPAACDGSPILGG